jgi:hypothetical protein
MTWPNINVPGRIPLKLTKLQHQLCHGTIETRAVLACREYRPSLPLHQTRVQGDMVIQLVPRPNPRLQKFRLHTYAMEPVCIPMVKDVTRTTLWRPEMS